MQWRKAPALLYLRKHSFVYEYGLGKSLTPVDNPVPYCVDLVNIIDHPGIRITQPVEDQIDGVFVVVGPNLLLAVVLPRDPVDKPCSP